MFIFIPIISVFCAYPNEIRTLLLPDIYEKAAYLFPIFAIATFSHEFLKLINVKYHLNNKTYIETALAILFVLFSFFGTLYMATRESIIGASLIVLTCEVGLVISNIVIRFKNLNYINYVKVIKTLCFMLFISIISYTIVTAFYITTLSKIMCILKIVIFITLNYIISIYYRKYLLS